MAALIRPSACALTTETAIFDSLAGNLWANSTVSGARSYEPSHLAAWRRLDWNPGSRVHRFPMLAIQTIFTEKFLFWPFSYSVISSRQPEHDDLQKEMQKNMPLSQKADLEILAIANPIMDHLMEASRRIDYENHVRDFTDRAKSALSKEWFDIVCREYQGTKGFFGQREFVTLFRRPDSVALVWKQSFSLQAGDYVAEMVLVEENGHYLVDHVMVF